MPSPGIANNRNKMRTVGFNHFINLSLPLRNVFKACTCPPNSSKMESGVVQVSNAVAKGWVLRSFREDLVLVYRGVEYLSKVRGGGRAGCLIVS